MVVGTYFWASASYINTCLSVGGVVATFWICSIVTVAPAGRFTQFVPLK